MFPGVSGNEIQILYPVNIDVFVKDLTNFPKINGPFRSFETTVPTYTYSIIEEDRGHRMLVEFMKLRKLQRIGCEY